MRDRGPDRRHPFSSLKHAPPGTTERRKKSDDRRRHGFISQLQLFATIPYQAVESVLAECAVRDVPAGAILLEPGQANDSIHLLISGRLRIHLENAESEDYIPIEEGGCFGELSIIDGRPVSAYVVADKPSRIVMIHERQFWDQLIPQPGVARNLLNVLSERMRLNRDIIIARMKDKLALEHLQKELSIARDIQISMLPPGSRLLPAQLNVQAYAIMEAAKNVGGDFYDAFFVSPDRLFVAVGDVSGKGIPAALFMARTLTQMRIEAVRGRSPSDVLEAVNRSLCEGNDAGMFVTIFCGVIDTQTGHFEFANAGHNPPLLVRPDAQNHFIIVKKGLVAGIMENTRYPLDALQLKPREAVLLYTDGVTEAMNTGEAFYTEERLVAVSRTRAWDNPGLLVEALRADIAAFARGAPQADDITMLAVLYRGAKIQAAGSATAWLPA